MSTITSAMPRWQSRSANGSTALQRSRAERLVVASESHTGERRREWGVSAPGMLRRFRSAQSRGPLMSGLGIGRPSTDSAQGAHCTRHVATTRGRPADGDAP